MSEHKHDHTHDHTHDHEHEHHETEEELRRWVDYAGAGVGLLCAVHCALTPLALSLAPIAGVGVLWREEGEGALMIALAALAVLSAVAAVLRSRHWGVALTFITSLTLMYVSHEALEANQAPALLFGLSAPLIASIAGGLGVMSAHLWSLKLQRERACCQA